MPSSVKPLDPNLRQRLAATLSGDSKPGSLRHHLVEGLLGSSVGDDSGLVGYTPLGMVFAADAANRDRRMGGSGAGHTLEAAAGMIPGGGKAGPMLGKAINALAPEEASLLRQVLMEHNGGGPGSLAEYNTQHVMDAVDKQWGRLSEKGQSIVKSAMDKMGLETKAGKAAAALDQSRLPKMERVVGSKARNRALDDELGNIEEEAYQRSGPPDLSHDPRTNPSPMSANDLGNSKLTVRQQLEKAVQTEAPKPLGHDIVIGSKQHVKAANDYLDKLGEGGEQQFMHDNDLTTSQETIDHLMENYDPEELIAMTDRMDPLTSREYRQGGTDMNRERDLADHIKSIQDRVEKPGDIPPGSIHVDGENHSPGDQLRGELIGGENAFGKKPTIRQHGTAGSPGRTPDEPIYTGQEPVGKGPKKMDLSPEEVSNGDPQKLNFIRNAMDDEGGNSAEDVAITYLQHLSKKDPKAFDALHDRLDPTGADPDLALNYLVDNYSIPELMAMHYDLDPKTFSKAYKMPAAKPKGRPTQ